MQSFRSLRLASRAILTAFVPLLALQFLGQFLSTNTALASHSPLFSKPTHTLYSLGNPSPCLVFLTEKYLEAGSDPVEKIARVRLHVSPIVFEKAMALSLKASKREALEAFIFAPENLIFFDERVTAATYGRDANQVSDLEIADKVMNAFTQNQALNYRNSKQKHPFSEAVASAIVSGRVIGKQALKWAFITLFSVSVTKAAAPKLDPMMADLGAFFFRAWDGGSKRSTAPTLSPEIHRDLEFIWETSNVSIPQVERDGRMHYVEGVQSTLPSENAILSLAFNRPKPGDSEEVKEVWRETVKFHSAQIQNATKLFPDFYGSEQGKVIRAHQEKLLEFTKKLLSEQP